MRRYKAMEVDGLYGAAETGKLTVGGGCLMNQDTIQTTLRLLRNARAGDRQSLEDLFTRYLPKIRQIVALRLGYPLRDFAVYEDLVQEAILRAFEKLDTFKEMSEGTFYNWISSCVLTAVNLHFRKEGAQKRGGGKVRALGTLQTGGLSVSLFTARDPGPSTAARVHETEEKIEEALLALKSHHREVIILRHLCGMSSEEVARSMGFGKAATARKVLSRAMEQLRAILPEDIVSPP